MKILLRAEIALAKQAGFDAGHDLYAGHARLAENKFAAEKPSQSSAPQKL